MCRRAAELALCKERPATESLQTPCRMHGGCQTDCILKLERDGFHTGGLKLLFPRVVSNRALSLSGRQCQGQSLLSIPQLAPGAPWTRRLAPSPRETLSPRVFPSTALSTLLCVFYLLHLRETDLPTSVPRLRWRMRNVITGLV